MDEYLADEYEGHVDVLIELITKFSELADKSVYQSVFNAVVSELKQIESPDSKATNAWEFLGVINYYGHDHGLCEVAESDLRDTVENAINSLPLHERFLFILANRQRYFNWQKDFKHDELSLDDLIRYMTKDEPFFAAVEYIAEAIQSHAPDFSPYE
ncbi:hypothetical protein [Methylobacter psychrophilus]|uniref:hypothetical protein n=1 Tax=Methylobacter psychrophilus TaxID=96941 RepID=UPI0021D50DAE|nr:hypothetical protein [Methylobacter psychrophilus]